MITNTIFGKKLLMIATITVLVTGLTLTATLGDALAKESGDHKLKCKSVGSFFPLSATTVSSSSIGKCNAGLGHVTSASVSSIAPSITNPVCLPLSSVTPVGDFAMGKKGFITFTTTGEQCFFDENGDPTAPSNFCEDGGAHTSTVTGTYAITGGLVHKKVVTGGTGEFVSMANHCDDNAPYGNSFTTELTGNIITQDNDDKHHEEHD